MKPIIISEEEAKAYDIEPPASNLSSYDLLMLVAHRQHQLLVNLKMLADALKK